MVWVLLVSLLLLWLVALIESMILSVPVSHHWRIKSAICMFYSSKLYIPVTKHIKPFESLAPETTMVGTQEAFEGRSLYLSVFLTSLFHKSSHYPTSWLLGNLSTKLVCVKRGAFQGRITQIKGKQVAFVKWISEMESIILFQYECSGRVKIRGKKTELKIAISV